MILPNGEWVEAHTVLPREAEAVGKPSCKQSAARIDADHGPNRKQYSIHLFVDDEVVVLLARPTG